MSQERSVDILSHSGSRSPLTFKTGMRLMSFLSVIESSRMIHFGMMSRVASFVSSSNLSGEDPGKILSILPKVRYLAITGSDNSTVELRVGKVNMPALSQSKTKLGSVMLIEQPLLVNHSSVIAGCTIIGSTVVIIVSAVLLRHLTVNKNSPTRTVAILVYNLF